MKQNTKILTEANHSKRMERKSETYNLTLTLNKLL